MRSTSRTCATSVVAALLLLTPIAADEKETFYQPIEKNLEGWTIKVDPQLVKGEHAELGDKALSALANHLQRIKFILDEKRVAVLQKRPIWIERDNPKIRGMQYHPGRGWLIAHDLDPHLVKHVHIPQAGELLTRQVWAKHPYVILHELAHAYHDQVLKPKSFRYSKKRETRVFTTRCCCIQGRMFVTMHSVITKSTSQK